MLAKLLTGQACCPSKGDYDSIKALNEMRKNEENGVPAALLANFFDKYLDESLWSPLWSELVTCFCAYDPKNDRTQACALL